MTNVRNQTHLTLFPNGIVVYLLLESKQHNSFMMAEVQNFADLNFKTNQIFKKKLSDQQMLYN